MTLEERAREVLWTTLDGLQMTERQRAAATAAMLAYAAEERERCISTAYAQCYRGRFPDAEIEPHMDRFDDGVRRACAAIRNLEQGQ